MSLQTKTIDELQTHLQQQCDSTPVIQLLIDRIQALENELKEANAKLAEANAKLADVTSELQQANTKLQIAAIEKSHLEEKLHSVNTQLLELAEENKTLPVSTILQNDLNHAQSKIEKLEADLQEAKNTSSRIDEERRKLLDRILEGNRHVEHIRQNSILPTIEQSKPGKIGGKYYDQLRAVNRTIDLLTGTDKTKISRDGDLRLIEYYKNTLQTL